MQFIKTYNLLFRCFFGLSKYYKTREKKNPP